MLVGVGVVTVVLIRFARHVRGAARLNCTLAGGCWCPRRARLAQAGAIGQHFELVHEAQPIDLLGGPTSGATLLQLLLARRLLGVHSVGTLLFRLLLVPLLLTCQLV